MADVKDTPRFGEMATLVVEARDKKGYSQAMLAGLLNLNKRMVQFWEKGVKAVGEGQILAVCRTLGINEQALRDGIALGRKRSPDGVQKAISSKVRKPTVEVKPKAQRAVKVEQKPVVKAEKPVATTEPKRRGRPKVVLTEDQKEARAYSKREWYRQHHGFAGRGSHATEFNPKVHKTPAQLRGEEPKKRKNAA